MPMSPTVTISGGRILTMDSKNQVINGGTIRIRDGKLGAVQSSAAGGPPQGARRRNPFFTFIDAKGRYVTPGLIDAWSAAGLDTGGPSAGGKASHSARDAINAFDSQVYAETIRQGVTSLCIEPPSGNGVAGLAAFVRLENPTDLDATLTENACLVIRVGLGRVGPFGRLNEIKALRTLFQSAKDHREAWEEYEEELEKYEKDLKSGKKVKLKKDDKEVAPEQGGKPTPPPPPDRRRGRRRPPRGDDAHASVRFPAAGIEGLYTYIPGAPRCDKHPWVQMVCCCPEDHGEDEVKCEHDHMDDVILPDWLTSNLNSGDSARKDDKKDGDFAKPELPARDADLEVLVQTLKRELRVRFEVHRPADILNVLEIVRDFNLNATISGASGGGYVADQLADSEATVLLSEFIPSASFEPTHLRDLRFDNVSRLRSAGVPMIIGSGRGGESGRSPYLAQLAALAVSQGLSRDAAMRAITIDAARLCGMDDKVGSLEKGKAGDVVVWKGHPLASDSVVEYVFIGGRQVYPPVEEGDE